MIEFLLNRKKISTNVKSGENLLQFIREHEHLKGTKIGCREGDCGACTVLVGTLQNGKVDYKSVTSCLSSLAAVHGKHVVTVEGLNIENQLNKAQQAMHEHAATQCGFCTPGFVVSMTGTVLDSSSKHATTIDALSGNICRCTGYKSIEKAANQFDSEIGDAEHNLDWFIQHGFVPEYFSTVSKILEDMQTIVPYANSRAVAGGTDVYVREADDLADLTINYLQVNNKIEITAEKIILGGGVTVTQLWDSPEMNQIFPKLRQHLQLISSKQIRNMATIAGNFVNASPIGDLSVFFLALNAELCLKSEANTERRLALRNFFLDYKKLDLQKNERIESIEFSIPSGAFFFNFEKVSKRQYLDIASVNSAISFTIEKNIIKEAHVSLGGVAAVPKYLTKTSAFLVGKLADETTIAAATEFAQSEISPIDDLRGSQAYKRALASQLLLQHILVFKGEKF